MEGCCSPAGRARWVSKGGDGVACFPSFKIARCSGLGMRLLFVSGNTGEMKRRAFLKKMIPLTSLLFLELGAFERVDRVGEER